MDCQKIVGSWHPGGFHGHFRSKTRNDVLNQYRYFAKPTPPSKFLDRAKVRSNQHLFSSHDNRNSHSNNMKDLETHFTLGLGKKKPAHSQHTKNTRDLLKWVNEPPMFETSYSSTYNPMKKYMIHQNPLPESINSASSKPLPDSYSTAEPIHVRRNPTLKRRILTSAKYNVSVQQKSPLLAWSNTDMDCGYHKPCVGDSLKRNISRDHFDSIRIETALTTVR